MLAGKRSAKVGDLIFRGIAEILAQKVKDPRVKGVTLTGINLSNDLKHAMVYFSVMGNEDHVIRAQYGLDSAKGYIKREIGARVKLRYVPDIIFEHDPSLEMGDKMEKLFQEIKAKEQEEDPN
ncbi:30S ribosome-binding factor RbfA, partial [Thermodesulfobacteriota bacterium]